MKDIAIYGAGGFGREVACLINIINAKKAIWNLIGFFDDGKRIGDKNEYGSVIGGIEELNDWNKPLSVAFAIGSSENLAKLVSSVDNHLIDFPNIIAPDVTFLDRSNLKIGIGNVICVGCLISCNVTIGNFNILISMTTIGHDAIIGNCNVFMPATRISGQVVIGNENFFGVSSTILQKICIGNHTNVGARSLIIRKTKDGMSYMGSPATLVHY